VTVLDPSKIRTLIFLEGTGGSLKKFSKQRFSRLFSLDKTETLSAQAGKWIQVAQITVAMKAHEPPMILQAHFLRYRIAKNGRFDPACRMDHLRMGQAQFEIWWGQTEGKKIPDPAPRVELEKLRKRLLWKPTAAQARAVRQQALAQVALAWKKTLNPSVSSKLRKRLKTSAQSRAEEHSPHAGWHKVTGPDRPRSTPQPP
jgi:hypothetical protein